MPSLLLVGNRDDTEMTRKFVDGSGPVPCDLLICAEAPAYNELRQGRALVGKSGKVTWQLLLRYASLTREDAYVTNVCKELAPDNPTEKQIERWTPRLLEELEEVQPKVVATLGLHATRWFLGPDATMERCHGLPHKCIIPGPDGSFGSDSPVVTVLPCYHPAAGLHTTNDLQMTAQDFEVLGEVVRGRRGPRPVDEWPEPNYKVCAPYPPEHRSPYCAVDTEGPAAAPWNLSWCTYPGEAGLIATTHQYLIRQFAEWLGETRPLVVMHNALHDLPVLRTMGIDILGMGLPIADTMVLAFDLQLPHRGLKTLAYRHCGMEMQSWREVCGPYEQELVNRYLEEVVNRVDDWPPGVGRKHGIARLAKARLGKPRKAWEELDPQLRAPVEDTMGVMAPLSMTHIPMDQLLPYACRDADATLRLYLQLRDRIEAEELVTVAQLDHLALPSIDRMQTVGMPLCQTRVQTLERELREQADELLEEIRVLVDNEEFNPGSGKQIADWCATEEQKHGRCALVRKTKGRTRYATDETVLEEIKDDHPVIPRLLERSKLMKLLTAYASKLLPVGDRYYPDFKVASVVSGRLAEWILTFPAATETGRKVRSCFVAPDGYRFGTADLSQIELRVMADESQDPTMCRIFNEGGCIHTGTAAEIFGKRPEDVDKLTERYPSKSVNFLVSYGGDEHTLQKKLAVMKMLWELERCRDFVDRWYILYAGVKRYMTRKRDKARQFGYVSDRWGRRRYLPALHLHGNEQFDRLAEEAERQAGNFPCQAGAGGLIKRTQGRLWQHGLPALWSQNIHVQPVLQYHDELVFLYPEEYEAEVKAVVLDAMVADGPLFRIPILSDWSSARDWGGLK